MSAGRQFRQSVFVTCIVAMILCFAVVSARPQPASAPALPVETNAPAASLTNVTERAASPGVAETNVLHRLDYAAFKIINERNIFNANRTRRSSREGRGERTRQVKVETFSLVGTMSYAKGDFAFFDGSSSSYKKALKTHDRIAGYKVADVLPNAVKLEADGNTIELAVGEKMRREDEGAWKRVGSAAANKSDTSAALTAEDSSDSESGGDNDVLKKLLQKREEELNK